MSDRSEWGDMENPVVPAGLRAYRHFIVHRDLGILRAMSTMHLPEKNEEEAVDLYWNDAVRQLCNYDPEPGRVYQSGCKDYLYYKAYAEQEREEGQPLSSFNTKRIMIHEAMGDPPNRSCECGFYASYSPETNFYHPGGYAKVLQNGNFATHAVVEVSGRTIMGTKGCRAEKMQIKALGLEKTGTNPWMAEGDAERMRDNMYVFLGQVAAKYGVPAYRDAEAMHQDFPPQDISHLITTE